MWGEVMAYHEIRNRQKYTKQYPMLELKIKYNNLDATIFHRGQELGLRSICVEKKRKS
jgi:hypothetical protein